MQHLANEIYGPLDLILILHEHCADCPLSYGKVQPERWYGLGLAQNWRARQIFLEFYEGLLTLLRPDKPVVPFQTLEVWVALFSACGYESGQGGHPPCELLHFLLIGGAPHCQNGGALLGVNLDSPLRQEKPQKFPCFYTKNTLFRIQLQLVPGYRDEQLFQVGDVLVFL